MTPQERTPRSLLAAFLALFCVLGALAFAGLGTGSESSSKQARERAASGEREGGESFQAFAREHAAARRLPVAVLHEKLQENGAEAKREATDGPAQQQFDQRAYPKQTIGTEQAVRARRAYAAAPRRLTRSDFGTARQAARAEATGLSSAWESLGPKTPIVPAQVTYTGHPTLNSGRTTAMAIAPDCGQAGRGCRLWIGAAGGGVWRTEDARAAKPTWTSVSNGLPTQAIGSLAVDPNVATGATIYAGTGEPNGSSDSEAGLGLYRSTDGGDTWAVVPGSVAVAKDRSIGSIAIQRGAAGHILIGTDLARHGSSSSNGGRRTPPGAPKLGLYESTDGGASFADTTIPAPADPTDPATGRDFFTGGVNKVQFDPRAGNTSVYAAVFGYGVFRRNQGSGSWTRIFRTRYAADNPADDPDSPPDSTGDRTEFDTVLNGGSVRIYIGDSSDDYGYSALFRDDAAQSLTADAGFNAGATTDAARHPAIDASLSSADITNTDAFTSYFFCHSQCGYDIFVKADPNAPDTVYLGGSMNYDEIFGAGAPAPVSPNRTNGRAVVRSTDAGVSFTDMTNEPKPNIQDAPDADPADLAEGIHPDQHTIALDPTDPNRFYEGNDGGVVRVSGPYVDDSARCAARAAAATAAEAPFRTGELALCQQALSGVPTTVDSISDGLDTLQFQSVSVGTGDPRSDLLGGTQDNGTWAFDGKGNWFESIGGDGGNSAIDTPGGFRIHTYYGPTMDVNFQGNDPDTWDYISEPMDTANAGCGTGDPKGECFSFYVPVTNDPVNPGTIFTAGEYVWRTQDAGGDRDDLDANCRETAFAIGNSKQVCGDFERLGGNKGHLGTAANYIVATERSAADKGTLWVGRRRGGVFFTSNADDPKAGKVRFTEIADAKLPGRFVSSIHVDPANPRHAWVSYSGYDAYTPSTPGHVFEITVPTTGAPVVTNISGGPGDGIGDQPVTDLVRDDATGDLYAATDFGVLRRPAGATTWQKAAEGLPPTATYGLTISPQGRVLYAATHGRGVWRVALAPAPAAPVNTPGQPPVTVPVVTPAPKPVAKPKPKPVKQTLGSLKARARRLSGGRRTLTLSLTVGKPAKMRIKVSLRGRSLGTRTVTVRKAGKLTVHVTVRVRGRVTSKTRLSVSLQSGSAFKRVSVRP